MGYVARDGSSDGRAHYFPRIAGVSIEHVVDANARLSLDPATHPTDTFQVIQDDDGLTYTFNGPGDDADAGLLVTLAGTANWRGAYIVSSPVSYDKIGSTEQVTQDIRRNWIMGADYMTIVSQDHPWQADWPNAIGSGSSPNPTVQRNPIASLTNWTS